MHGHYADAGYVGTRVAHVLGLPLVHTGHSLGRVKRRRLIASGLDPATIERRYAMSRRVAAEERTLAAAVRVITSTHQEIEEQYELYDFYRPSAMRIIPPGTDLSRFHPPRGDEQGTAIAAEVQRFLREPDKPMILALSRADARKNITTLLNAYGQDTTLRERANLVLVIGNRDDLNELGDGARDVFTEILQLIDRHDLYGHVAYPKQHRSEDVPVIYRLATLSGGVFVNPALTEPFGLTLIEAAASGLPIVATEDGGPRDIVANCDNGILIDPLDPREIARAIREIVDDWEGWQRRSATGLAKVREHYVWSAHAEEYLSMLRPLLESDPATRERPPLAPVATGGRQYGLVGRPPLGGTRQPAYADRMLVSDLNRCLLGDELALAKLRKVIRTNRRHFLFGIISGLRLDAVLRLMRRHRIPSPTSSSPAPAPRSPTSPNSSRTSPGRAASSGSGPRRSCVGCSPTCLGWYPASAPSRASSRSATPTIPRSPPRPRRSPRCCFARSRRSTCSIRTDASSTSCRSAPRKGWRCATSPRAGTCRSSGCWRSADRGRTRA